MTPDSVAAAAATKAVRRFTVLHPPMGSTTFPFIGSFWTSLKMFPNRLMGTTICLGVTQIWITFQKLPIADFPDGDGISVRRSQDQLRIGEGGRESSTGLLGSDHTPIPTAKDRNA
jgi:hypothetical protein